MDFSEVVNTLDRHALSGTLTPDVATLAEQMDLYRVPLVSVAVGDRNGDTWANDGQDLAFQACSISKHVAAFGTLRLVTDGTLDLDTNVNEYLTSWQVPGRQVVTLRQLLAHTAGLSYNWFRGYAAGEPVPTLLETLRGTGPANTPPVRPSLLPGSRFRYSGSHYAVLQQLLTDVTGTPFEELMQTLVLAPLNMADSSYDQRFPDLHPVAPGFHNDDSPVPGGWRTIPESAGAGLWTTPADLVRLELEIIRATSGESKLLSRDAATQMLKSPIPDGTYGLGTEVQNGRFGHWGGNVGYNCFSFAWAGSGVAVAAMSNSEGAAELLNSLLNAAARRYGPVPLPSGTAEGRYLLREDYPIDVQVEEGGIVLFAAAGQPPVELTSLSNGNYRHPGLDLEIHFGDGVMEMHQEGTVDRLERR